MKKNWKRKIVQLIVSGVMCLSLSVYAAQIDNTVSAQKSQGGITPYFTYIATAYNSLVLNSGERFTCAGETQVYIGYDAALTMDWL